MKAFRIVAMISAAAIGVSLGRWAQGPGQGSETVGKKKPDATKKDAPPETTAEKIPSKFGKKAEVPEGVPTFRTDALTVTVDVAVLDNKGHFIPKIPRGNFRVLEDNVPQQVSSYSIGEAPMTICMVIEFSNRYQQFYSEPWFQTLNAAYGFLQT